MPKAMNTKYLPKPILYLSNSRLKDVFIVVDVMQFICRSNITELLGTRALNPMKFEHK